jgi:hypothetical protein
MMGQSVEKMLHLVLWFLQSLYLAIPNTFFLRQVPPELLYAGSCFLKPVTCFARFEANKSVHH